MVDRVTEDYRVGTFSPTPLTSGEGVGLEVGSPLANDVLNDALVRKPP